ncbi:MAG: chemotaxis protein CheA [Bacteroidota bacterium]|nr:MAG: chemotaxis protein CheA [Bacteroidota bacterium]
MSVNKKGNQYIEELELISNTLQSELSLLGQNQDKSIITSIYSHCHKITELAGIYGLNSISGLFGIFEQGLVNTKESSPTLNQAQKNLISAAIEITPQILQDLSLKNQTLKNRYTQLKKEIGEAFSADKNAAEESGFANKRFQEIFIDEAFDLINQLEEKLLQLESEPNDLVLVDNIFRIMHTLKGNSNMFGFEHLGEITHHLENIYDAIRGQKLTVTRTILNLTLQCIDHFRNLIEDNDLANPANLAVQTEILAEIGAILANKQSPAEIAKDVHNASGDLKLYYLFFKPQPNVFDDGSNPLYYVYDLHELGKCIVQGVVAPLNNPYELSPETCSTCWHILLTTAVTKEGILENFMFLPDSSQPQIEYLGMADAASNQEIIKLFNKNKKSFQSISSLLMAEHHKQNTEISSAHNELLDSKKAGAADSSIASIRVASAKVDQMMNLISELVTKQAELSMLASQHNIPRLQEVAENIENISRDLRDNAFSISLIPLEKSVLRFQRLVRDVSTKFNKKIDFIVEGKETEMDKTIIEKIVDPIMHILRNSIDHGIETPDVRKKMGKPETGTIVLKAYPSGAHVIIEISDDGSGINTEKVRQAAVKRGYLSGAEELTTDDMLKLILSPGFSTAENVSEVSGRGVGMDVVNQKISEIRGELEIHTEAGKGTNIIIKLPLTISIIDSLLVMIGKTYYLLPLAIVERCTEVKTPVITESKTQYLDMSGEYIPFIDLHKEFGIEEERLDYQRLIVFKHRGQYVSLVVDQIIGNHQAVLKPLGNAYRRQEIISGASILGNGEVALVLDASKLAQEFTLQSENLANEMHRRNAQFV